jgi:hypothetical protein
VSNDDHGCCFSCKGLGVGGPASGPETNGRCADCRGEGCAHEGPCGEIPPTRVDHEVCGTCNDLSLVVETFDDQIGFEEQARPVVVTVLHCGHENVRPGRWEVSR